jgi:adenine deaminase
MTQAINWVIRNKGGIALHDGTQVHGLPLEIAGIMSTGAVKNAADKYKDLSEKTTALGTQLKAPFMTLAFMALLVIPELKISDKGLFDGNTFSFIPLFVSQHE